MAKVIVQKGEPLDKALYRFKRACNKDGIRDEVMKREHYMKPSEVRRLKHNKAVKRIKERCKA